LPMSWHEIADTLPKSQVKVVRNPEVPGAYTAPLKVFFDVSNYCNLRCPHCLSDSLPTGRSFLSWHLLSRLLDECSDIGVFVIKFGGGEPFLHPRLLEALRYVRACDMASSVTTNGLICSSEIIQCVRECDTAISVSIDGDEETHDGIRGKGTFARTI